MMFLSRISIIYDAKNTLAPSSTTGGAVGGAYVIDMLLHFACIFTHFPLKTKGFPIENQCILRPKLKSDGFTAKIERPDSEKTHSYHGNDTGNERFMEIDEGSTDRKNIFFMKKYC